MATSPEQPSTTAASANSPAHHPAVLETEIAGQITPAVEMTTLPARVEPSSSSEKPQSAAPISSNAPQLSLPADEPSFSQNIAQAQSAAAASENTAVPSSSAAEAPALTRHETEAIGPSTDSVIAAPIVDLDVSSGPVITITLLLTSGARHPYKIDEKYLKKRNVKVDSMDPFNISVYTLKELILRDWRSEWETPPSSPSSIRLIHFGRMLDDKQPLKNCRFQQESPNVVHMTIKPQDVVDDEDAQKGKGGRRADSDDDDAHATCRCVIL